VKIVHIETILKRGGYSKSEHWRSTRSSLHKAIMKCEWPPGGGRFTIYPQSGKRRGQGNGVKPIRNEFISELKRHGWTIEGRAKNALGQALGEFDAVLLGPGGPVVAEWETGNISSSHRSMNKLTMLVADGLIASGTLIVPSRRLYVYLTDRIGNYKELQPYLKLWKSLPCKKGILEVVVIEHDAESWDVPRIPKGTDGRAKG
jgi:Restriction endonuclease BamHI